MELSVCAFCFLFLLCSITGVYGWPQGPPNTQCDNMAPNPGSAGHNAQPQSTDAPYNVIHNIPNNTAYTGWEYNVTIDGGTFKGFFCQVRNDTDSTTAIGSFTSFSSKGQNVDCTTAKGAVGHTNRDDVDSFVATWTAPGISPGDVQLRFFCTVVQAKATYWVKVPSTQFIVKPKPTTQPPSTVTSNATSATTGTVTGGGSAGTVAGGGNAGTTPTPTNGARSNVAFASLGIMWLSVLVYILHI